MKMMAGILLVLVVSFSLYYPVEGNEEKEYICVVETKELCEYNSETGELSNCNDICE